MRKRKIVLLVILLSFSLLYINCKREDKKIKSVDFEYLGFERFENSYGMFMIFFKIKNESSDTLYLSRKNIDIKVLKGNSQIDSKPLGRGLILDKIKDESLVVKEQQQQEETKKLRFNFAKKIFYKNFGNAKSKDYKDYTIQAIENNCIVILPNRENYYSTLFINRLFDSTCNVEAAYKMNKIFMQFGEQGDDDVIYVYN